MKNEMSYDDIAGIQDELQEFGVYVSMIDGTPRHMDSYGTLTVEKKLQEWWDKNKTRFTENQWLCFAKQMDEYAYISRNCKILAGFVLDAIGYVRGYVRVLAVENTAETTEYKKKA